MTRTTDDREARAAEGLAWARRGVDRAMKARNIPEWHRDDALSAAGWRVFRALDRPIPPGRTWPQFCFYLGCLGAIDGVRSAACYQPREGGTQVRRYRPTFQVSQLSPEEAAALSLHFAWEEPDDAIVDDWWAGLIGRKIGPAAARVLRRHFQGQTLEEIGAGRETVSGTSGRIHRALARLAPKLQALTREEMSPC